MINWPYSYQRSTEFPGNNEPITEKQVAYIKSLADKNGGIIQSVIDSIPGVEGIDGLQTKGQASFVIKCLSGDIKPFPETTITPGAKQLDWVCSCGCKHITRCEIIDGELCIEMATCYCHKDIQHTLKARNLSA